MLIKRGILVALALVFFMPQISAARSYQGLPSLIQNYALISFEPGVQRSGLKPATENRFSRFYDLEKSIRQNTSFIDFPPSGGWYNSTRVIADYYFGTGQLVPLVGLSMGYVYGDEEFSQFAAGPEVGIKYYMNSNAFLYGLLEYQFRFDDLRSMEEIYDTGQFVYGVGFGLTFSYK